MKNRMVQFAPFLSLSVLLLGLAGCKGDTSIFTLLQGRAFFPPEFTGVLGELQPVSGTSFQVVDFEREAGRNVVATGVTDSQGNYAAQIPQATAVAVIVLGEVRVSGLLRADGADVQKDFNGITDVACEAGADAIADGSLTPAELTNERIQNLELGAAIVLQQRTVDFTNADGSRSAAAREVRTLTEDGAVAP